MWEHTRGCHHCQGQLWTVGWKVSNLFVSKRFQLCYISRRLYRPWNKKNRPCTMPSKWRGCEDLLSDPSPIFVHIFHWLNWLREGLPKKVAVLLDFVQLRGGGGPWPNFLSTFHKLYILGQFGDGEGGGDPMPNFFGTLALKKKWYKLSKLREGGGPR